MPTNDQSIMLTYDRTRLDGVRMDGQVWLRGDQIAPPLGYRDERNVRLLFERNEREFTPDESRVIAMPTAGGPQQVRVFSLQGVRLLAMLARTEPAARFRRWVLDLLSGRASLSREGVAPQPLSRLGEAEAMLSEPLVEAAIAKLDEADGRVADAQRRRAALYREAARMGRLAGCAPQDLIELRKLQRILARLPAQPSQATLPLNA